MTDIYEFFKTVFRYGPLEIKLPVHPASLEALKLQGVTEFVTTHGTIVPVAEPVSDESLADAVAHGEAMIRLARDLKAAMRND